MLFEFKSTATGTVLATQDVAETILRIIGKQGAKGVILPEQMPVALGALQTAIEAEKRAASNPPGEPAGSAVTSQSGSAASRVRDADEDTDGAPIALSRRAYPFLEMLRKAHAAGKEITWVSSSNASSSAQAVTHPFDEAIRLQVVSESSGRCQYHGLASRLYWNQVGPFGGYTAALLLNSVLLAPQRLGDPIALTVNFAAPMEARAFALETQCVRSSRTTQHWQMHLTQDGQTVATATAVLGVRRDTWHRMELAMPQNLPSPDTAPSLTTGGMPWMRLYNIRPIRNQPDADALQTHTHVWISDSPQRALDFASLTAIADTILPWMFRQRKQMIPVSTVSMSVYFHVGAAELANVSDHNVYIRSFGQICHEGFMDSNGQLWSPGGRLLATTQQMMWVKS